jgi:hypothetical protein
MQTMNPYMVLKVRNPEELESQVNKYLSEGWLIYGDFRVWGDFLTQAMVNAHSEESIVSDFAQELH